MKLGRIVLVLSCSLTAMPAFGVGFQVAKECKKAPCKHQIAVCVNQACAQFHGLVKFACKKTARITIRNACSVVPDHVGFCNDLQVGNGCTPD